MYSGQSPGLSTLKVVTLEIGCVVAVAEGVGLGVRETAVKKTITTDTAATVYMGRCGLQRIKRGG